MYLVTADNVLHDSVQNSGPGEGGWCFSLLHHAVEGELQLGSRCFLLLLLFLLRYLRCPDLPQRGLLCFLDSGLLALHNIHAVMLQCNVTAAAQVSPDVPAGVPTSDGLFLQILPVGSVSRIPRYLAVRCDLLANSAPVALFGSGRHTAILQLQLESYCELEREDGEQVCGGLGFCYGFFG